MMSSRALVSGPAKVGVGTLSSDLKVKYVYKWSNFVPQGSISYNCLQS